MSRPPVIVITAEELMPPGTKLPEWACRTCGGCGEMTTCDRWDPRRSRPCEACGGTGKKRPSDDPIRRRIEMIVCDLGDLDKPRPSPEPWECTWQLLRAVRKAKREAQDLGAPREVVDRFDAYTDELAEAAMSVRTSR